ncbi:MAG: DUF6351 family protein [Hyphomonadaceae bacterium]
MPGYRKHLLAGGAAVLATAIAAPALSQSGSPVVQGKIEIKILSSRYDLVSGGDALVEVRASEGAKASELKLSLNGRALVTPLTFDQPSNTLRGLVAGLDDGTNWLQARGPTGYSVSQALVNHPITGPILSGPHLTPYECRTEQSGLGDPTDENCSAPVKFEWFYKSTGPATGAGANATQFKPLAERGARPSDLAMTTTIDGKTAPYIVRVESGVINRAIYRIAVLDDPASDGVSAAEGWNGRLGVTFGGGCGTQYNQGQNTAMSVLNDLYLGRGFAFMNSTELVNQLHCNQVLQGETLMMLKEHFIEGYGVPKWTVGTGGSGGAIQQLGITQMYPGLLDGIQPSASFPDSSMQTADCGLLQHFWKSSAGKAWSQEKKTAVEGLTPGTCAAWERSFVRTIQAAFADGCGIADKTLVYDPKRNPKGVRCTTQEMRVNIYGRDPKTGFARRPIDNVGLQYGLKALNDKVISVDEFLQLNEKIGGNDVDGGFSSKRTLGDEAAIKAIYASGLFNTYGGGLAIVPIIHYRGYTDALGDIHDRHRDLTIRARLEKATGRSDNQVIWVGPPRAEGVANLGVEALNVMTDWLDALAADPTPLTTDKVVKHKPAKATDAYWLTDGTMKAETASWDNSTGFGQTYPVHGEPRLMAGAPVANDVMKCQLKAVDFSAYAVKFSSSQQARMKKIFPGGVCDWSKPSVGYSMIKGTYQRY